MSKRLRRHLTVTTILAVVPFLGHGRAAYAECVPSPSPTFVCSGADTATQNITANNANVSTAPGFSVAVTIGNGVNVDGNGHIRFTDDNASTMIGAIDGLNVQSTGDVGGVLGAVTVVTNGNITGLGDDGIDAQNLGSGALAITANGSVTGGRLDGIFAFNSADGANLTITTGAGSVISGGDQGIDARNNGSGVFAITANGSVTGKNGDGIYALNNEDANLTITTGAGSVVTGGDSGITAENRGSGNLAITADGAVTGGDNGISASNEGDGESIITVGATGLVQGGSAGIGVLSGGQDTLITNFGIVRNLSGEAQDQAIATEGGATNILNSGRIIGTVTFAGNFASDFFTEGVWNSAGGVNDFGAGNDVVRNRGIFIAADNGASFETTRLLGLESFFNNLGLMSLADGGEGDSLEMSGGYAGGEEGRLAVDALLGSSGQSDRLIVGGSTSDTTTISVNVVDALGANLDGIAVVTVTGATAEEHFNLDGPLNAGFFTWDLRLDGTTHELFTTGIGLGSFEFAAGITGAQEIWHQTTGTLLHRQADLRSLLDGTSVTPVADYAEPVAPTPVARITPGFWFSGVGAYIERDDEEEGFTLDRKQTIFGGMAGFDFGEQSAGQAWLFGVFAGYLTSDLEFDETNTEWTYEGPSVGLYATYLDRAFHADVTVKADFLDIDIDPEDLASGAEDADTDAVNLGGRIDAGYKIGESVFIEPQASLAIVHTEIDDVDIFGGTVEFDDATSVRGRLGLRLGFDQPGSDGTVYSGDVTASVWEEFSGDNDVTIVGAGLPAFGTDDPGETYGDVSVGFSVAAPEGWSGFLRGNYLFAEDYEAVTGNAGLRYAW